MALTIEKQFNTTEQRAYSPQELKATLLSTMDEFKALSQEWPALLEAAGIENLGLRYEWMMTLLKHFPQKNLRIIAVRDDNTQLRAAAPFCINRGKVRLFQRMLRYMQFIGSDIYLYDSMEIPVDRNIDGTEALRLIAEKLHDIRAQWDVIDLQSCSNQKQLEQLQQNLTRLPGSHHEITDAESMPYLALPANVSEYEQDRSKKRVHRDAKRFTKKFQEAEGLTPSLVYLPSSPEAEECLDRFFEQHTQYWLARTGKSSFQRHPQLAQFYKDILRLCPTTGDETPSLLFSTLQAGDITLSYQLGIWHGWGYMNYMNSYNPAYKEFRAGILHMDAVIRNSIDKGGREFSFGQGDEPYKDLWAEGRKPLWNFIFYKNRFSHACYHADHQLKRLFKK